MNALFRVFLFVVCFFVAWPASGICQQQELTSRDNHALLYAKQMGFSSQGIPVVRMRIAHGLTGLTFTPGAAFRVMPQGPGGAVIELEPKTTYTIHIKSPIPGRYQYGIILDRAKSSKALHDKQRLFTPDAVEMLELGSVFALRGKLFDNREHIVVTKQTESAEEVQAQLKSLQEKAPGADFDRYESLIAYPTAQLTLSDASGRIRIHHANILWIDFGDEPVVLHQLPAEDGKLSDFTLNQQLILTPGSDGMLTVVQSADVETILRGIVPAEIFPSAPAAALQAQAIAARTTLISQVGARHLADPYHLCNHQHCQAYHGLGRATSQTDLAIQATRGKILFSGKELVKSYYSSHCGGFSADAGETWGFLSVPYLVSKADTKGQGEPLSDETAFRRWLEAGWEHSYCAPPTDGQNAFQSTRHARWTVTLTQSELQQIVRQKRQDVGEITGVTILERGRSFRATKVRIQGKKGEIVIERELPIRRFFNNLKSALFVIDTITDKGRLQAVRFDGAGFGHGVGLCQTGAIGMAQRHFDAEAILRHYYPNTHVETIW